MDDNPRATQIIHNKNEQDEIISIISQLKKNKHVNAFFVLSNYLDCPDIKNQPEFYEILFNKNIEVVIELFQWMLIPKYTIKKKNIKVNADSYPCQSREFLKDNWCFYEKMYISIRLNKFQFISIFKFLKEEFFDRNTIWTALGYLADVLIPFAKYQFSASFNVTQTLTQAWAVDGIETFSIMKIITETIFNELVQYAHYEPIFQFLKTALYVGLQDSTQQQSSKIFLIKLINSCKIKEIFSPFSQSDLIYNINICNSLDRLENIHSLLKEIHQTIQLNISTLSENQPFFNLGHNQFSNIQILVASNLITYCVQEMRSYRNSVKKDKNEKLYSSLDLELKKQDKNAKQALVSSIRGINVYLTSLDQVEDQEIAQVIIKILIQLVQIYKIIPKYRIGYQVEQQDEQLFQSGTCTSPTSPSFLNNLKKSFKTISLSSYSKVICVYSQQIQYLLNNLQNLNKLIYTGSPFTTSGKNNCPQESLERSSAKVFGFSSGQNIKKIGLLKYSYLRLINSCLGAGEKDRSERKIEQMQNTNSQKQMISEKDEQEVKINFVDMPELVVPLQRLQILQIIKRYLCQNRWNNITQKVLIQICQQIICKNYTFMKKNIQKDKSKKMSEGFLAYLIENFNKRQFVFLNTVKFTTQGNLYALYKISKTLAYSLNNSNELTIFLNQFQPWRNFIINDLKNYEQKLYPVSVSPPNLDEIDLESLTIKVDEADSIKKLVENIATTKKWERKQKTMKQLKFKTSKSFSRKKSFINTPTVPSREEQENLQKIKSKILRSESLFGQKILTDVKDQTRQFELVDRNEDPKKKHRKKLSICFGNQQIQKQ